MSNKTPVFSIFEPHHFSDYGFDPQFDYFQVLEEARKHKKETAKTIDLLHFKLQKPISKDDKQARKKRRWWWKNALVFFKSKCVHHHQKRPSPLDYHHSHFHGGIRSISGPIYITDSLIGSTTPCRTTTRPASSPIAASLTPSRIGGSELPYMNLRDMNGDHQHGILAHPMPIYLVT